jgi:HPt (histidine-containing phosphotransfer) domain-containing protein
MNDHITKPVEPARLMAALYRWTVVRRASLAAERTRTVAGADSTAAAGSSAPSRVNAALSAPSVTSTAALSASVASAAGLAAPSLAPATVPAPTEPALSVLDVNEGIKGCLGRPALFAQGLKIFLDVYSPVERQLADCKPADPKAGDPDVRRLAHTLKGSVRSLGMFQLAGLAARIDAELRAGAAPSEAHVDALRSCLQATLMQAQASFDKVTAEAAGAPARPGAGTPNRQ